MAEFVLNRSYVLFGKGHAINFTKGQPTWVPPSLHKEATAIGAERLDGEKVDVLDPEAPPPKEELSAEERIAELKPAFDMICERNVSSDFGGDNRPTVAALNKILSFETTKKERDTAWVEYKAEKA